MQTKIFIYQGSTIFYRTVGIGTPVVLLHGFGEDGEVWKHQIDFLKNNFRLIIPDIPGSGKSQFIENATIETYAEIVKLLLDIELQEAEGVSMIGHSMGGYITLAFAEKYPTHLKSFSLFHSSAFADTEEKKQTRAKAISFIENHSAYDFLKTATAGLFKNQSDNNIPLLVEKGKDFTADALIQYYQAMINRPDRTNVLKETLLPVLFIIGEYDTAIPMQSGLQQCYLPAQSHVFVLSNSGHMSMLEETEKINGILIDFLQLSN